MGACTNCQDEKEVRCDHPRYAMGEEKMKKYFCDICAHLIAFEGLHYVSDGVTSDVIAKDRCSSELTFFVKFVNILEICETCHAKIQSCLLDHHLEMSHFVNNLIEKKGQPS